MIVEGSPAQAGGDAPILPHRRRDRPPQPGGTFDTGEQVPAESDTSDLPDQEQ